MKDVAIGSRADDFMITDIAGFSEKETGGILLGYYRKKDEKIEVIEAIDGGFRAIHESSFFSWDQEYVNHLADLFSRLFSPPLEVVGVWHKHNHDCDPPFSSEDDEMHRKMLKTCKNSIVSILFQKVNDDEYRKRVFIINQAGVCAEVDVE